MAHDARTEYAPGLGEWLEYPRAELARRVRDRPDPLVVGWPFDGTRRWYLLHRRDNPKAPDYASAVVGAQARKHRLLFELGASAILAPCFGYELLGRGEKYTYAVAQAAFRLGEDPVNARMFEEGVRVKFYGDYETALDTPALRPMLESCRELEERTRDNEGPLLLLGLFADEHYERLSEISARFASEHGRAPDRRELIRAYYGAEVPDLSLYLAFARPSLFDVPLVATGKESIYATLTPSPEVSELQLREILYDHMVLRPSEDSDYESFPEKALDAMQSYSDAHRDQTLGVGRIHPVTGIWHPLLPGEQAGQTDL